MSWNVTQFVIHICHRYFLNYLNYLTAEEMIEIKTADNLLLGKTSFRTIQNGKRSTKKLRMTSLKAPPSACFYYRIHASNSNQKLDKSLIWNIMIRQWLICYKTNRRHAWKSWQFSYRKKSSNLLHALYKLCNFRFFDKGNALAKELKFSSYPLELKNTYELL